MSLKEEFSKCLEEIHNSEANYTRLAVVGQPGAGKSSLINNLLGQKVAATGQGTDVTVKLTEYDFCVLKIVDLPGYGTERFQYEAWLKEFPLEQFDAFIYVFSGKFTEDDDKLFAYFQQHRDKQVLLVRNHCNSLASEVEKQQVLADVGAHYGEAKVYFVDCGRYKAGIDTLRAVCMGDELIGIWKKRLHESFTRAKAEHLQKAFLQAEEAISTYKKLAGANGLNPILGVDIAADLGIYYKMFQDIRDVYGIAEADFKLYMGVPLAGKLLQLLTKEGLVLLLQSFGSRLAAKNAVKYVPFIGQAAAVALGWQLCKMAGNDYNSKCQQFADEVLDELIDEALAKVNTQSFAQ